MRPGNSIEPGSIPNLDASMSMTSGLSPYCIKKSLSSFWSASPPSLPKLNAIRFDRLFEPLGPNSCSPMRPVTSCTRLGRGGILSTIQAVSNADIALRRRVHHIAITLFNRMSETIRSAAIKSS